MLTAAGSYTRSRAQRIVGLLLQVAGLVWLAVTGAGLLLLGVILAFDQFVSERAGWVVLAGAAVVAVGLIMLIVGSWLRGETDMARAGYR